MKAAVVCAMVSMLALVCAAAPAAQDVKSTITAVTVYGDRALVRRVATVDVAPGEQAFVFSGLPPILDSNSVRASGGGTASAKLVGLDIKVVPTTQSPEERVQALRDEIKAIEDRIQVVTDELAVLTEQQRFITQMSLSARQTAAQQVQLNEIKTDEWQAVLTFVGTNLGELMQAARGKNATLRGLNAELEIKKADLGRLSTEGVVKTKQVTVSVDVLKAGTLELVLEYVVLGAAWAPMYDARANLETREVELTYSGTIAQRTGEDWINVRLALSTAQPAVGAQVPPLPRWFLDSGWRPRETRGFGGEEVVTEGGFAEVEPDVEFEPETTESFRAYYETPSVVEQLRPELAVIAERGTSAVFEVKKVETVPSDGQPHRTTIGMLTLTGTLHYTIVPKARLTAFVETEVTNTSALRLLSGPVHVFVGPDFIGMGSLRGVAPGESFALSLGPEERIKVERELLADRTAVSHWRDRVAIRNAVRITVKNFTGRSAAIRVKDQVPVSHDADAKVSMLSATGKIKPDEVSGELEWAFDLAPGATKELEFEFEFSFPKDAFDYYRYNPQYETGS